MPAYLTQGSRQYNQARRIHPKDSVSQLGYYQDSNNNSSSLSSSSVSSIRNITSSTSTSVPLPIINRYRSPVNSSKFSAETHNVLPRAIKIEQINAKMMQKPLSEANHRKKSYSGLNTNHIKPSKDVDSTFESAKSHQSPSLRAPINRGRQNLARLKRRNFNRRMLVIGDDHFVNPYALSELFSQSEIPGFREIFASDSYLRKFCWVVAFLFMTVLSLNDMTELITEYYKYPITVDVRQRDSSRLPFPSVTVCNLNVVRFSSLCNPSSSSKFDITGQIPSELRDKLCGIQVEKKRNQSDVDISDINNIGITTTTSTTTTANPTTLASNATDSNSDDQSTETIAGDPATTQPSGTINTTPGATTPATNPTTTVLGPAEHKNDKVAPPNSQATTTIAPELSTRQKPSNGGLDLGDLGEPSLLTLDRHDYSHRYNPLNPRNAKRRSSRSIKLTESGHLAENQAHLRPFASSKSQIRLKHQVGLQAPEESKKTMSMAGQFNKQGPNNLLANKINTQQPPSRTGFTLNPNLINNPSNNNNNNNNNNNINNSNNNNNNNNNIQNPYLTTTTQSPVNNVTNFVPAALPEDFELTERQERELQENLTNWLAVMYNRDPKLTWALGHQFDDMVLRCTMKSINCTHQRSFENSFTPTEGNCFTYRSRVKRKSPGSSQSPYEEANLAGTNQGLELVLNLEKNEYISGSSQVGALVMIHHPSDLGYTASEATFIAPEYTTYIGLKMVNITRLPAPYPENCVDSWPVKFADKLTRNSTYSQQACFQICLQKTIQSHCQCQSAFLPIVELDNQPATTISSSVATNKHSQNGTGSTGADSSGGASANGANVTISQQQQQQQQQRIIICDTRKSHTRQCVKEVMFRAADRVHHCECPPKCQVIRYDRTISMARWPTREDKVSFDRGKMDVNFQNLAKVIVYFQTMTCEEVAQQAVFNGAKLFSALGGIMGMYVGFSFLSVFEIFEVMSRKLWHYVKVKLFSTTNCLLKCCR